MKLRKVVACAMVAAMTLGLAACGSSSSTPKDESTSEGKKVVRFMVNGSDEELKIYDKAVTAFNEQSETTEVELIGVTGDDYSAQLMTQLQSDEAPDVFYSEEGSYGELNNSGMLMDLTDYLNDSESALTLDEIPENILANYTFDGQITGVPVDSNPEVIYYNADLFEELGIKSPAEYVAEGTWNFENFSKVCAELKEKGKIGFVWENWWGPAYSFLLNAGDSLYTEDGEANIDTERVNAGMEYLESNMADGNFVYAGSLESGESADSLFLAGDTAMVYNGRWSVPDYNEAEFTYDVCLFPYYEEPSQAVSAMPATPMVMNINSPNPDNAWEFISYYCGAEGQRIRMEGQGNAVPTIDGLEDIVLTETPANSQAFLDARDIAFLYPQVENTHPGLTDALTGEIESMLVGDQDAATTVKNMQAAAEEILAE